jgi:hypothetical protein
MVCRVCHEGKLLSAFSKDSKQSNGKRTICRACDYIQRNRHKRRRPDLWAAKEERYTAIHIEWHQQHFQSYSAVYRQKIREALADGTLLVPEMKRYGRCKLEKPREDFSRASSSPDGLAGYAAPARVTINRNAKPVRPHDRHWNAEATSHQNGKD